MLKLKDELRAIREEVARAGRYEDLKTRLALRKEEMFAKARIKLKEAAWERRDSAIVLTISDLEENLIDLSGCYASELDDPPEVVEQARARVRALGIDRLRGNAAELRDYLVGEGLQLSLHHRVEGHHCNDQYNVWALKATF